MHFLIHQINQLKKSARMKQFKEQKNLSTQISISIMQEVVIKHHKNPVKASASS
jgi:hypothetical protein